MRELIAKLPVIPAKSFDKIRMNGWLCKHPLSVQMPPFAVGGYGFLLSLPKDFAGMTGLSRVASSFANVPSAVV